MPSPMQKRPKFCGLNITRSIQDRIFLGLMGLLFMLPSGYLLYKSFIAKRPPDTGLGARLFLIFVEEFALTIFLLSGCCLIGE